MDNVVAILIRERASAAERADACSAELRDLRQRMREIDDAVELLNGHIPAVKPSRSTGGELKTLILNCVQSHGSEGVTAREIAASLTFRGRETSEPSASSTLSRMKTDGEVENRQGRWYPRTTKASDTEVPEASNEFGRVAELEVPARSEQHPYRKGENVGSSPTPPSFIQAGDYDSDLDDDVPF
jgi:hypothetical protein